MGLRRRRSSRPCRGGGSPGKEVEPPPPWEITRAAAAMPRRGRSSHRRLAGEGARTRRCHGASKGPHPRPPEAGKELVPPLPGLPRVPTPATGAPARARGGNSRAPARDCAGRWGSRELRKEPPSGASSPDLRKERRREECGPGLGARRDGRVGLGKRRKGKRRTVIYVISGRWVIL